MKKLALFYTLLIFSCAQQTQPTGGPKDEAAPLLEESNPANGATNFKGTQIELSFNELVQLNNAKDQIIISPAIKETEATYLRNKVILKFKTALKDSTTYTINFREAVQDITEKNPAKDLKLAFSTGSYLDSLTLSGQVYDLISGKVLKDITIALHEKNDTFNIFKHRAEIITKANEKGAFVFENLKPSQFFIYAFQDKNKNLIVDRRNEKYGFKSALINLDSSKSDISVPLISLDSRNLLMISAKPLQNYFNIRTNKGIKAYSIEGDGKKFISQRSGDNATIKVYPKHTLTDSTLTRISIIDSLDNKVDTTLYVKFNTPNPQLKLDKFNVNVEPINIIDKTRELTTSVSFSKPIKAINLDSIFYKVDSLTQYTFNKEEAKYDTSQQLLTIKKVIAKPKEVKDVSVKQIDLFVFGKAAFISIDNDSSARTELKPKLFTEESLSIMLVETNTKASNYIIQLLDNKGKVIQQSYNTPSATFSNLPAAEYSLRLIEDSNNNRQWDNGNYFKKIESEPIYYYYDETGEQKISLKANWELGPLLINTLIRVNNLSKTTPK